MERRRPRRRRRVPLVARRLRADDRGDRDELGHRPVLDRAHDELDAFGGRRPRRPGDRARAVGRDAGARRRAPGRPGHLRAARARLLDRRRDRARGRARHLPCLHPRVGGHRPARAARRRRHQHGAPAADVRHRHDRGEPGSAGHPRVRPRVVRPGLARAAGLPRADPRPRRLQLGLRPVPLPGARGLVRGRPERSRPRGRVPRDGRGAARDGPAGRARRGVQPHRRIGSGSEVGARPDRARLLPAPELGGQRRDLDVLPEHRHRARGRREAHGRLGRAVGEGVQGRRLPLRPDGPPLEGEHAGRS